MTSDRTTRAAYLFPVGSITRTPTPPRSSTIQLPQFPTRASRVARGLGISSRGCGRGRHSVLRLAAAPVWPFPPRAPPPPGCCPCRSARPDEGSDPPRAACISSRCGSPRRAPPPAGSGHLRTSYLSSRRAPPRCSRARRSPAVAAGGRARPSVPPPPLPTFWPRLAARRPTGRGQPICSTCAAHRSILKQNVTRDGLDLVRLRVKLVCMDNDEPRGNSSPFCAPP